MVDKLKKLKRLLKIWNKEIFGDIDFNIKRFEVEIECLEKRNKVDELDETG